jgi:putative transposase
MCRIQEIHPSGLYAWLIHTASTRAFADRRLLGQIRQCWIGSGFFYGYRNITLDMKDHGERCGRNHVHLTMRAACIQRHRGFKGGALNHVAPNDLIERQLTWPVGVDDVGRLI